MSTLNDRSILVIGATGGLGEPIVRTLAAEGAKLTLVARDADRLNALGVPGVIVTGDLRETATAQRAVEAAVAEHGGIDGVIVASGVVAFGPIEEVPDEVLLDLFLVNTLGPIRVVQAATPHLKASASAGRDPFVVNLSAVVAEQPTAGMAAYSASKAALTAFDAAAGRELRRAGIRLVDVRPPHTETGLSERPLAGTAPRLPQGLQPEAVAQRVIKAILDDEKELPSSSFA
jgi:NAD(P)-dependent dehydrogenase (short-subunit alcohol dehydrogenase family)